VSWKDIGVKGIAPFNDFLLVPFQEHGLISSTEWYGMVYETTSVDLFRPGRADDIWQRRRTRTYANPRKICTTEASS
jgi:hypothetical protein